MTPHEVKELFRLFGDMYQSAADSSRQSVAATRAIREMLEGWEPSFAANATDEIEATRRKMIELANRAEQAFLSAANATSAMAAATSEIADEDTESDAIQTE